MATRKLKFISLFSGIGGFDLGFERAGMECVAQVEWDKHASSVLATHYPDVQRFEDVRDVGRHNLPAADVICGGFPCQDVSIARRDREGLAGNRSGLWFEFLRIITELSPRVVVIENVPGLLSSNGGHDFAAILYGLVKHGYRVCWRVLDAQYFGLAQRRKRVFIVGSLGNGSAAEILLESYGGKGHSATGGQTGEGTAASVNGSADEHRVSRTLRSIGRNADTAAALVTGTLAASGAGSSRPAGQANETDMLVVETFAFRRSDEYADASVGSTLASRDYKSARDLVVESVDVRNLRTGGDVSGVLQAKQQGYSLNYINPVRIDKRVRRLTPVECERLQGFPDGWTAGQSDTQRYKQLGNAVAVNVLEWIGERMMKAVHSDP